MRDKSELLDQLRIDRSVGEASGGVSKLAAALMVIAAVSATVTITYFLSRPATLEPTANTATPLAGAAIQVGNAVAPHTDATPAAKNLSNANADRRILDAAGYITARRIATVSSEITGRIVALNVEEGMLVETGQVLARLDNAIATIDLELAESNLPVLWAAAESIEANLAEARRVLARSIELRERSLATEADETRDRAAVDALAANHRNARANIEVAKLEVRRRREILDDHIIRAPFGGVVTAKNAEPGEIISPGSAGGGFTRTGICTIVDMDSLEIEVDVNESFIGRVFAGQEVEATLDAYPDWRILAAVIAIIPTADRAKATVRVRIQLQSKDPRILPDMGVKVAFLKD